MTTQELAGYTDAQLSKRIQWAHAMGWQDEVDAYRDELERRYPKM